MKCKGWAYALIVVLVALCAHFARAGTIVIDDFSCGEGTHNSGGSGSQNQWTDTTNGTCTLGAYRDGSVGCEIWEFNGNTMARVKDGVLEIITNDQSSPSVYLSYDDTSGWGEPPDPENTPFNGSFSDAAGILDSAQDLTGGGSNNQFEFLFTYAYEDDEDHSNFFQDFRVTLIDSDSNTASYNAGMESAGGDGTANTWMSSVYDDLNDGIPASFTIPFSKFSGVDLTAVEGINLHICSEEKGSDYTLDAIVATPEPASASLALLAAGVGALVARRKRRRKPPAGAHTTD